MNFEQLLKNAYDSNDHYIMLNDADYFLHCLAETYDPTYKENYRLLEKAVRQGVGRIIHRYISLGHAPTKIDTIKIVRQVTEQCNFTASETSVILKALYYMVGWKYPDFFYAGSITSSQAILGKSIIEQKSVIVKKKWILIPIIVVSIFAFTIGIWFGFEYKASAPYVKDLGGRDWGTSPQLVGYYLTDYEICSKFWAPVIVKMSGLNWKEQALKMVKYSLNDHFSEKSLTDILKNNGFTEEQIEYAISHCGADWKSEAVKRGETILRRLDDPYSYDKKSLINSLTSEWEFTQYEAEYAANQLLGAE